MQAPRLNDVLTRVVAWHNRHPLARRIRVAQVHSIGEVVLPFASVQAGSAATQPAPVEAARPVQPSAASLAAVVLARAAGRPARPSWVPQPAVAEGPIDPADIDLALGDEDGAADTAADPGGAAADAATSPDLPPDLPPEPAAECLPGVAAAAVSTAAETHQGGWLARLRGRLAGRRPGLPRLEAAFGRDFLWPLTPQQVARWARRRGQPRPLAPPDWPQRRVAPDPARLAALRQKGLSRTLELHLLTAAIGVGDRRIRLLLDGSGHVLGPRAYSPRRIAVAAVAIAAAAIAAAMSGALLPWHLADPGLAAPVAPVALVAPAIAAPAPDESAIESRAAPASAATTVESAPPAVAAAAAEASTASEPAADAPAAPPADIRPPLSDDERRAAREQSERLRGHASAAPVEAAPAATGPVYAVVARPSRQREAAAGDLVQMQSVAARLPPPAPDHAELMQTGGEWRAAWWPFASLADAERARVMLAGRGLKAEVVEF